ncbi:MAG: hypothetical protein IIA67_04150 [Planctomycetes bacterium]|nr:hypothetical protein [Planctomycetota bacterium]
MHYPNSEVTQALKRAKTSPVVSRSSKRGLFQCLVVSEDALRLDMLCRSAEQSGWETIVCTEAEGAMHVVVRTLLQLAIVDLESDTGQRPVGFERLLRKLAETSDILLITCGNDGNIQEEIWARQLGVWLYLPAVIDIEGMATMCDEARQIADRRVTFS